MLEVYASLNSADILVRQAMLEEAGIQTFVRNDNLSRCVNVLIEFFQPALCVVDPADYEEAMRLLKTLEQPSPLSDWLCPRCGETVPASFESCWNCETALK